MARIIKKGGIMSSLVKHAEKELRAAGLYDEDSDYGGMLAESVMELIKLFSKQGHSGCSAGMTISLFKMLANYETITPLTGEDDEWNFIGDRFQNKRNSAVFKDKDGQAYYIDAITWKTQNDTSWSGRADGISSAQNIKSFPFMPKRFVIDVIEEEVAKDDWELHIKNKKDLDKVWEVYDPREC